VKGLSLFPVLSELLFEPLWALSPAKSEEAWPSRWRLAVLF
jgi:hypothetical protein